MTKQLLKRADVLEWTGLSPDQYRKMLDAKALRPIKIKGYKINLFRRRHVAEVFQLEAPL